MFDWTHVSGDLAAQGFATLRVLDAAACRALADLYDDDTRYRSRVVMQRYNYGRGEYKYLAYPLPEPVAGLRTALYPPLAAIANEWRAALGEAGRFPPTLEAFLERVPCGGTDAADAAAAALWCLATSTACIRISMARWCSRCS